MEHTVVESVSSKIGVADHRHRATTVSSKSTWNSAEKYARHSDGKRLRRDFAFLPRSVFLSRTKVTKRQWIE